MEEKRLMSDWRAFNRWMANISKGLGTSFVMGYPSALMVEPTNYCNLTCTLCPTGAGWLKHPQGRMDVTVFRRLVDEAGPYLDRIAFWNWGEPFLHPNLMEMVGYSRQWPAWLQLCTNGHFFTNHRLTKEVVESGLNQLIVSMDGSTSESIQKYRGQNADLARILTGIENLASLRASLGQAGPYIEVQFLVMHHNQDEIEMARSMAFNAGADHFYCKTINMRAEDLEQYHSLLPDAPEYRRFELDERGQWAVRGNPNGVCPYVYQTAVVLWDGSLLPCCFDGEEAVVLGNAFKDGLWQAWNSRQFRSFRYRVRHSRPTIPMCAWCPEERSEDRVQLGWFWTNLSS
jgi:MoaA/NifB/PqqE/SkfB family radical SAM enzyme